MALAHSFAFLVLRHHRESIKFTKCPPFYKAALPKFDALSNRMCHCRTFYPEHLGQTDSAVPAPPTHGKVDLLHNICADCPFVSKNKQALEQHASDAGHSPFPCICGAQFARLYCLTRHVNSKIGPSFLCGLCDKSFPRLDKLGDHLRLWHRLGHKAFNRYKGGDSCTESVSPPAGGNPPMHAEEPRQAYPVAPGFEAISIFDGLASAANIAPDASSVQSTASPGSSTVSSDVCGSPARNASD